MGLSASQGRLLSITARLTDNEYQTQRLTNEQMRLSTLGQQAMKDYHKSLGAQQLEFITFNNGSNMVKEDLTPAILWQYQPMKNQYALFNSADQVLVSGVDGKNFKETKSLSEFLKRYGLLKDNSITKTWSIDEQIKVENPEYDKDWANYNSAYENWVSVTPPKKITNVISEAYDEITPAWTERVHTSELYQAAMETGCMGGALAMTNCYMHVLSSFIGAGTHTTSDGNTFTVYDGQGEVSTPCDHGRYWCWNTDRHPVSDYLKQALKQKYCCGEEHDEEVTINWAGSLYTLPTKSSDCDPTKTVYQKVVDLLWRIHEDYDVGSDTGGQANREHIAEFYHILEFDLDEATLVDHEQEIIHHDAVIEETDNPAYYEWLAAEPQKPTTEEFTIETKTREIEKTVEYIELTDKLKGQWYTNLWYRMNGYMEPDKVTMKDIEDELGNTIYYYTLEAINKPKNEKTDAYSILDENLSASQTWLYDALEAGIIRMEQVRDNLSSDIKKLNWQSIAYSSASDILQEDDEQAVAMAQAKYEAEMETINAKDKKIQQKITKLETEHQALKQQYDSVQSAMNQNISRSYKTFQG